MSSRRALAALRLPSPLLQRWNGLAAAGSAAPSTSTTVPAACVDPAASQSAQAALSWPSICSASASSASAWAWGPSQYRSMSSCSSGGGGGGGGCGSGGCGSASPALSSKGATPLLNYQSEALARLTPAAVVDRLDRSIIGQADAKKAVAVAFRNRWRRHRVRDEMRDEIHPKNILMIGPTGCGKTEIARRLAKLADAPFIKVEATKFTEIGYHGRDVDSIIKDLVEASLSLVRTKLREQAKEQLRNAVNVQLVRLLALSGAGGHEAQAEASRWAGASGVPTNPLPPNMDALLTKLTEGKLEQTMVEVEMPSKPLELSGQPQNSPLVISLDKLMGAARKEKRRMPVHEARAHLEEAEIEKMYPNEVITREAIRLAEQDGIVFIDEIDKIVQSRNTPWRTGDPSAQGVQRDLLPIIEGSTVQTKHGNVNTDHILFICSGAFHSAKPSDLMAELQGRLPIRVELRALTRDDFYRILTEPQYNLIRQQQMLLATEGVDLHFTDAAIREIARLAEEANRLLDNIGARRLASVLEKVVEQISFAAPELVAQARKNGQERYQCIVDKENVAEKLAVTMKKQDLSKYII